MNYYNEIDPGAIKWLKCLIAAGLIPPGIVDSRPIQEVYPNDLREFTQCHFFAGIGGWSEALRLANWPTDRPVWTGSCPCQPFSQAGQGAGFDDERHLWPYFDYLIQECSPGTVFGEQVASKDGLRWLDLVQDDLEGKGYAFAAVDLCAPSVGASHIRQRSWWMGYSQQQRLEGHGWNVSHGGKPGRVEAQQSGPVAETGSTSRLADNNNRCQSGNQIRSDAEKHDNEYGGSEGNTFWSNADWLFCRDGKWRPVESGTFPLGHGLPARVVRLRGYGNAIVPQVAAEFIKAFMEVTE